MSISSEDRDQIEEMLSQIPKDATMDELVQDIVEAFGGTRAYAKTLFIEFNTMQPGSTGRQRILQQVGDLVSRMSSISRNTSSDTSELTEDDLKAQLKSLMQD